MVEVYLPFRLRSITFIIPSVNRLNSISALAGSVTSIRSQAFAVHIAAILLDNNAPVIPPPNAGSMNPAIVPVQ